MYGVRKNKTREIGYDSKWRINSEKYNKPKTLHSHFFPSGQQNGVLPKGKTF